MKQELVERTVACALTRREILSAIVASLAAASCADTRPRHGDTANVIDLPAFMAMSRVLTDTAEVGDEAVGREYLAAVLEDPARAAQLAALWRTASFGSARPPASVLDLVARGVYDDPELAALADSIAACWYSGVYDGADGEPKVATYVDALAWRALGYRSGGPSSCSGVFGHWADKPLAA